MIATFEDVLVACRTDPLLFGSKVLGRTRWSKQEEIRRALNEHRHVVIRSANGVGKTFELASIICEWLALNKRARVVCAGPSFGNIEAGLWQEVRRAYYGSLVPLGGIMLGSEWVAGDGWDAAVVSPKNVSAVHGRRGERVLVVIDEAQGVENVEYWDALESLTSADASRVIVSGNPLWPQGQFHALHSKPGWHQIRIDGFEHPNILEQREVIPGSITQRWIDERREEWNEDDPRWTARVRGEFPDAGARQYLSVKDLSDAWSAWEAWAAGVVKVAPLAPMNQRRLGLDVARFGGDRNVLTVIGEDARVAHIESWTGEDLMATTGRLVNACKTWDVNPRLACVDVCGMGAGVVDRAREQGLKVRAVDFGSAPVGDWSAVVGKEAKYRNRKGELHEVVRNLVRSKRLAIGPEWRNLRADLIALDFSFDGSGRFLVSDKEDMRRSIGRSPDFSDSLVIAFGTRTGTDGNQIW